jgi:hypothetical protein
MKMKVRELIEELKNFDPESEVHFSYNYGDHWRTIVAPAVEHADEEFVTHSEYHRMPRLLDPDEHEEAYDKGDLGGPSVVVLSA